MKKRYLITVPIWGQLYLRIFLEQQLRSVLDETNLSNPLIQEKYDIEFRIYTDAETKDALMAHPNFARLKSVARVNVVEFEWTGKTQQVKHDSRYSKLMQVFHDSVNYATEPGLIPYDYVTAWVGDLVVARDFFPKILKKMDDGHDAVFVLPMRTAFEALSPVLNQTNRALDAIALFNAGYRMLHPLWQACNYHAPLFTTLPFAFLWTTRTGIMARSFSITPIVFKPNRDMLDTRGMIDGDIPQFFSNPYWCEDWIDAPVIGLEPLFCYYNTMWSNGPVKPSHIKRWAHAALHPTQLPFLKKRLYYPSKAIAKVGFIKRLRSDRAVRGLA